LGGTLAYGSLVGPIRKVSWKRRMTCPRDLSTGGSVDDDRAWADLAWRRPVQPGVPLNNVEVFSEFSDPDQ
jgi:hypothetical protein